MTKLIVVGDKFIQCAKNRSGIVSVSQFEDMLWNGCFDSVDKVIFGQGIELGKITRTLSKIKRYYSDKIPLMLNLADVYSQNDKAHHQTTHKHKKQNVLIGRTRKVSDKIFTSSLVIQDSSELLDDHSTGQHVQGMILIEAARQLILSVTETYFIDSEKNIKRYFALSSLNIIFSHFIFPMPVKLTMIVNDIAYSKHDSLFVDCKILFEQNDTIKTEISIACKVYHLDFIAKVEDEMASSSFLDCIDNYVFENNILENNASDSGV